MNKFDNQISRMKTMMNYGLKTESKTQYSDIEYSRVGADGKLYGIVREGTKYYIKVSNKTNNVLKENFDYIGGFRNRKNHEYNSYANALKNFEMKMHSINEALDKKDSIVIESWNPDRKEMLTLEATEKMRKEIARQRQIMGNVNMIQEKKNYTVNLKEEECCKVDKECADTQKNNIAKKSDGKGEPTEQGGDPFTEKTEKEASSTQKTNVKKEFKPVMENDETLAWNDDEEYLDETDGTEVGDGAPFTEELTEGFFHNDNVSDDEQLPDTPEEIQLESEESDAEVDDDSNFDDAEVEYELEAGDDDALEDDEFEEDLYDVEDEALEEDEFDDDVETRLSSIEDLLDKIAEKVGVDTFDDDDLYDEEESEEDDEETEEKGDETEEDEYEVFESKNFRKAMLKEDEFRYFGEHPAYQKEPMELSNEECYEQDGYYDMNDESVLNNKPYGEEVGDGEPFEVDIEVIENAIAESIKRMMKKKI